MAERRELSSSLTGETLVRKGLFKRIDVIPQVRILPELNVVKIGGYGLIDFGRTVVVPLMEEIGELSDQEKSRIINTQLLSSPAPWLGTLDCSFYSPSLEGDCILQYTYPF